MKAIKIFALSLSCAFALSACGGDSDMENGAKKHGENIGKKQCECSKAAPADGPKCAEEMISMTKDYNAFMETAKEEGSDMEALEKLYKEAFKDAAMACE